MPRRDRTDERLPRRLAIGYAISLVLHALIALFFFSVVTSSSQQSSPEAIEGAPALTVSHVQLSTRAKSSPVTKPVPAPHAPRVARLQGLPIIAGHRPVPTHRELAKNVPNAPPNPTPAPAAPLARNQERAQPALATPTPAPIAAVPFSLPTAVPIIAPKPVFKPQPTAAPSAAPTARATALPHPAASPLPLKSPVVAASALPTRAPVTPGPIAHASPAPAASAAARVAGSPAPQRTAGVPSPAPSGAARPSAQRGNAPSPGPKPIGSAGPVPAAKVSVKAQPPRPISLPPTPSPRPSVRPTSSPAKLTSQKEKAYADLNARLRKLLPNNPVHPLTKRYSPGASAVPKPGEPTPPAEVVARTKYIFRAPARRAADRIVMWVTSLKKAGLLTMCTGWLVRYPSAPPSYGAAAAASSGPLHGGAVAVPDPGPRPQNAFMPIIEADATLLCQPSFLQPFSPPSAP